MTLGHPLTKRTVVAPPTTLHAISAEPRRSVFRGKCGRTTCMANQCSILQLRCSGEKSGCSRCKTSKATCAYTKSTRGDAAKYQRRRRSGSNLAQWTEDIKGQKGAVAQQQEQTRSLDAPFSQGTQSSQFSGDRNEGNSKNAPTPTRSMAQPINDHFLPSPASSAEPGMDVDTMMSEFVQGILPLYESSSMKDGEENFDFGLEPLSAMLQDGILPLDDSYGSSQQDKKYPDIYQSNEESEEHYAAKTLAASRSSAPQPSSTTTTRLFESMATDPPFYQCSPTSSPFPPHVTCVHENPFHLNQECPPPTSVSLREQKSSFPITPTLENCECLQEIGTLLPDLEHHQSWASATSLDSGIYGQGGI